MDFADSPVWYYKKYTYKNFKMTRKYRKMIVK